MALYIVKKNFGEANSLVDNFGDPKNSLRVMIVELSKQMKSVTAFLKTHQHGGGAVPDNASNVADFDITVE